MENAIKNIQARIEMLNKNVKELRAQGDNTTADLNEAQAHGLTVALQLIAMEG